MAVVGVGLLILTGAGLILTNLPGRDEVTRSPHAAATTPTRGTTTSPEVAKCVAELRSGAQAMSGLLAAGQSIDDVDDAVLKKLCRDTVLPAQAQARATAPMVPPVPVSAACDAAMAKVAKEPNSTAAEPLLRATVRACATSDEWLAALRAHPAAMALAGPEYVSKLDLQVICRTGEAAAAPMCVDAKAKGRL